jgi:subtilisin family serine protease
MKRIIIRPRVRGAAPAAEAMVNSLIAGGKKSGSRVIKRPVADGQHVVFLSDADTRSLAAARPDLVVEEDRPLELYRMPGLPTIMAAAEEEKWTVVVRGENEEPVVGCTVFAVGGQQGFRADTDLHGRALLRLHRSLVDRLIISPRQGYWSKVVAPPAPGVEVLQVTLAPLEAAKAAAWIHRLVGLKPEYAGPSGRGATVAVVDSGIAPVKGLHVVSGVNTLDGGDPARWDVDEKGHGTHCAGIIAARADTADAFRGIAPQVALYSAKVFPGGFTSDLIEAVDWCREKKIDLVNLSLGSPAWSEALALAIGEATDAGVTLVAAAGNDASTVAFPASHPDVLGISAIGRFGSFPTDSGHSLKVGPYRDWWGGLFSADFTNTGTEVNVCAPGVAIPSTVPTGYAAWDGTSMACPIVTGLLALILELYPALRTGTRSQSEALRWIAASAAANTGMPVPVQGHGLPTLPRMIAAARNVLGR